MMSFIDENRDAYGVEPICKALPITPSTYYLHAARKVDPEKVPARVQRDAALRPEIWRVWDDNHRVYGPRKVWRQLEREKVSVARCIVGWKASSTAHTDFVLDALEQALHACRPTSKALIHHSDRGVQYVSIRYTERLGEAGIEPSVGSVGDSYANALAETINGLSKAEVIHRQFWKSREAVELATLAWVDWFNHRRLIGLIGCVPPAEAEAEYYRQQATLAQAA